MTPAISLSHICKSFNKRIILNDINLTIQQGDIIGLLGPNGAGKSTLIKIMTGLLKPDSGEVQILGRLLNKDKHELRKDLGIAPQSLAIYPQLTVKQNLKSFGSINGLSTKQIKEKYFKILTIFGLKSLQNRTANDLSGGQKRRLHSAIALMGRAKIIFLDEPTVGADVDSRNQIIQAVKNLSQNGITIIYTTHYLQEMEALNAKIVFLNNGVIQATGSLENIVHQYAHPSLKLYFSGETPTNLEGWQRGENYLKSTDLEGAKNYAELLQTVLNEPTVRKQQLTDTRIIHSFKTAHHFNDFVKMVGCF
ncbi:ABC transporter ATP-binding protein [Lentilactobacillus hilgardii]|uniref:ABC transporter ATP-binding protein n=1 Tax=Lentilactobacillus hilgardii TaxID=1588 RepID=UPI003FA5D2E2